MSYRDEYDAFDIHPEPSPSRDYTVPLHAPALTASLHRYRGEGTRTERLADAQSILEDASYTAEDIYTFCRQTALEGAEGILLSRAIIPGVGTRRVHLPDMRGTAFVGAWNEGMDIVVHGDVGPGCGYGMRDGTITVRGDAGPHLAREMEGGLLTVEGDVEDAVGDMMVDGALVLHGDYTVGAPLRGATVYAGADMVEQVWPPD